MSETTEAKPELTSQVSKPSDLQKFTDGVILKGKLFGVEDVKKETGDDVCQDAMVKLKAIIAVKKEHKQKITIKINLEGIEINDESNLTLYKHAVNRISYIARDLKDARAIGYIYKNVDNSYQYFGLRTEKQAQELFNLLKDLFEVVLELRSNKKLEAKSNETKPVQQEKIETPKPVEVTPERVFNNSDKAPLISESEQVIETPSVVAAAPQQEQSLFDISSEITPQVVSQPAVVEDIFGLGDLSLEPQANTASPQVQAQNTPSPFAAGNNDLFSMLNMNAAIPVTTTPGAQVDNNLFGMAGMQNMMPQQQPNSFGLDLNNNQTIQTPAPRMAPIPPQAPAPSPTQTPAATNAFDDLFN